MNIQQNWQEMATLTDKIIRLAYQQQKIPYLQFWFSTILKLLTLQIPVRYKYMGFTVTAQTAPGHQQVQYWLQSEICILPSSHGYRWLFILDSQDLMKCRNILGLPARICACHDRNKHTYDTHNSKQASISLITSAIINRYISLHRYVGNHWLNKGHINYML